MTVREMMFIVFVGDGGVSTAGAEDKEAGRDRLAMQGWFWIMNGIFTVTSLLAVSLPRILLASSPMMRCFVVCL